MILAEKMEISSTEDEVKTKHKDLLLHIPTSLVLLLPSLLSFVISLPPNFTDNKYRAISTKPTLT